MAVFILLTFIFLFTFSPDAIANRYQPITNRYQPITDNSDNGLQTYIVHVEQPEGKGFSESQDLETWYKSFLPVTIPDVGGPKRLVYSYRNVVSGFAARLTEAEVKAMEAKNGFVSARPAQKFKLMTTHTPNFLGLYPQAGFWKDSNFGRGMIIGVLDTGVLPSHPSFSGEGMPPPPAKWKGKCEFNASERCNNKVIGARTFISEFGTPGAPPIDVEGHGSHTASTAAGAFVKGASALGNAVGTAAGMAPYAHLAIYKVCSIEDCLDVDLLAGIDTAVEDGVDIISLSIGSESKPFFEDGIAIGSFGAMQKGVLVSCSAGNSGPFNSTLSNEAPWVITVGASTIDRSITASAKLGNGEVFDGQSLFQPKDFPPTLLPLVYAGANGNQESAFCAEGSLNSADVKGKVVLCERGGDIPRIDKGKEVKNAGGAAMILMNGEAEAFSTSADAHVLPATHVSFADGLKIMAYINSSSNPMATIVFKGTVIGLATAPKVTSYSSRGPNLESPGILKPDIVGPGDSILAAWPFSVDNSTNSKLTFNIMSGTSMSAPHVAGIAALLKSAHPDWSPAAIKSAMMTTADLLSFERGPILDQTLHAADLFAIGAGHVNPSKASNPGLVYDIHPDDYISYLCGLGYTSTQVGILAHRSITCSNETSIAEGELNYPSFSVTLGWPKTFTRTVTNVGEAYSTYEVQTAGPRGVDVVVKPDKLYFTKKNQKLTYSVTFTRDVSYGQFSKGFLSWESPKYSVTIPISVTFENV